MPVFVSGHRRRSSAESSANSRSRARPAAGVPEPSHAVRARSAAAAVHSEPARPQVPLKLTTPLWERQRWVLAVILGAAAGAGLWQMRNTVSDDRMFARAQAGKTPASYRAYLEYGKRHRTAASTILLPRAELREAKKTGTVEAIDAFIAKNTSAAIANEIKAARYNALVVGVRKRPQVRERSSALHGFASQVSGPSARKARHEARHAVFARAYRTTRSAPPTAPKPAARCNACSLTPNAGPRKSSNGLRGPAVEVRFQRVASETLGRADIALSKNPSSTARCPTYALLRRHPPGTARTSHGGGLTDRFSQARSAPRS